MTSPLCYLVCILLLTMGSHTSGVSVLPTGQGALADPGTHLLENSDEKQRCERRLGATQPPSASLPGPGDCVLAGGTGSRHPSGV